MEIRDLVIILKTRKESLMSIMTVKKWKIEIKKMGSLRTMVCRALTILWFVRVSYLFITVTTASGKTTYGPLLRQNCSRRTQLREAMLLTIREHWGTEAGRGPWARSFQNCPSHRLPPVGLPANILLTVNYMG